MISDLISQLDLAEFPILALIGLLAGLVGGMLGVGGSIVMIPAMTEALGPDQHRYQAAAMIVNFFVVVPAVYQHRRAGAVQLSTVLRLVPLALIGVLMGVAMSELPVFSGSGEVYLRGLFGIFLLFIAAKEIIRLVRGAGSTLDISSTSGESTALIPWRRAAAIAFPTGIVGGMLGVGGGILAVPLQRRILGTPMRMAVANSATIIIATSFVGAIAKNFAYHVDHPGNESPFHLAAILIPTAIIGSMVGSRLTHRLPLGAIKTAFMILLMVAALRLLASSWSTMAS